MNKSIRNAATKGVAGKNKSMTIEEQQLWRKISEFTLDQEDSAFKFSQRLARENGWSNTFARKVIEEYKKFIFLCCITKTGVTPSDPVDQVWHLHLTFTKSYWNELCRNILGREIHHNPTKGGKAEGEKFNDFYSHTLQLYREKFDAEPPAEAWPDNETRFSDIDFQRVNLRNYWLIPRVGINRKKLALALILLVSGIIVQARSNPVEGVVIFFIIIGFIVSSVFKKGGRGGGGNGGCSTSGCGSSGDSGCSGCSSSGCSGCGSGCSGCGGGH